MKLTDWRKQNQKTLAETAGLIGLRGSNPARDLQRFETGERRPPALLVEQIALATGGEVTAQDMHETRLAWERAALEIAP